MRDSTIARNYADTLLELARRANDLGGYARLMAQVADAVRNDVRLRQFLESPKVSASAKNDVLAKAFQDRMPRIFVRFLQALVTNRRQMLIPEISDEFQNLVDEAEGRLHAEVTTAKVASHDERDAIAARLTQVFGKQVVLHMLVNPNIMGGVVVRVGDRVMDGSVRKRLASLRSRMAGTR